MQHEQLNRDHLDEQVSRIYDLGKQQQEYEKRVINLIASDNVIPAWRHTQSPYKGDMIQEGIVGDRPFAGAAFHNKIESLAAKIACDVFGAEHAILQSHSCSQANQAVYHALLADGDTALALRFSAGGHLTHGLRQNFSGRHFRFHHYGLNDSGLIDYDALRELAVDVHPKLIVCGSSSYPWLYDVHALRSICDRVGAKLMFDLSHEAGLIAAGVIDFPVAAADVITMSLDKTLRGPHGGIILCKANLASAIDRAVHPGTQSSFPIRRLTDAAAALLDTQTLDFYAYAKRALDLAEVMAGEFSLTSGLVFGSGTQKHYVLLNTREAFGIPGQVAEVRLEQVGILSDRQVLPSDGSARMSQASGLRIGTAWMASRGYEALEAQKIARLIVDLLREIHSNTEASNLVQKLLGVAREADCLHAHEPLWNFR